MIKFLKRIFSRTKKREVHREDGSPKFLPTSDSKLKPTTQEIQEIIDKKYLELKKIRDLLKNKSDALKLKENDLKEKELRIKNANDKLVENDNTNLLLIKRLEAERADLLEKFTKIENENNALIKINEQYLSDILKLNEVQAETINELEIEKNGRITELENSLSEKSQYEFREVDALKNLVKDLRNEITALQNEIERRKQSELNQLQKINKLNESITNLNQLIDSLNNSRSSDEKKIILDKDIESISSNGVNLNEVEVEQNEFNEIDTLLNAEPSIIRKDMSTSNETGSYLSQPISIDPIHRGGRARSSNPDTNDNPQSVQKVHKPKPKIVCWKNNWIWKIGLELPEELLINNNLVVTQDGELLSSDDNREDFFELKKVHGSVVIKYDSINEVRLNIEKNGMLIFKMSSSNSGEGILVKNYSYGAYIAAVPDHWVYNEEVSGPQITEPEKVCFSNLLAYYFYIDKTSPYKISFLDLNNEIKFANKIGQIYSLQGNRIEHTSAKSVLTFGKELPDVLIYDEALPSKVDSIIIGEEGPGRRNWKELISRSDDRNKIELSKLNIKILSGWYFLRFYNSDDELIDSCDFNFISSLHKIDYQNSSCVPDAEGHIPISIGLIHNSEFIVNSRHDQNIYKIISKTENKTIISVPADSQIEELEFAAQSSGGREIKFQIPIERIYWSIGNDSQDWQDKLIELRRDDFLLSNKTLSIKFPSIAWAPRVKVGFQNRDKRDYLISLDSKILKIKLSDFSDSHYEMTSSGRFTIECELIHNDLDIKFSPCQLVTQLSCQYCGNFRSFDYKEMVKHLFNDHFNSLFSDPLYAEIYSRIPDLPIYIYKCSHCKKYVSSFTDHPTSEIIKHTDDIHRGKNVEFKVVKRLDEIREFVLSDLPSFKKCKLCDEILEEIDCEEHFIKFHKDILYQ